MPYQTPPRLVHDAARGAFFTTFPSGRPTVPQPTAGGHALFQYTLSTRPTTGTASTTTTVDAQERARGWDGPDA